MKKHEERSVIGRREIADLPELGISGLPVKVDTGAYNSAIHCSRINRREDDILEVVFLDQAHPAFTGDTHDFSRFRVKTFRSSNGSAEERFVVNTEIRIGAATYSIDVSLTDRGDMRFTVLIGRKFLRANRFLVDPLRKNILSKKRKRSGS